MHMLPKGFQNWVMISTEWIKEDTANQKAVLHFLKVLINLVMICLDILIKCWKLFLHQNKALNPFLLSF